ncbi:MAG: 2-C-methyl-D-erythritol 2,4-cyclodiphosphate synthase [Dictyoglomus thermophilum]|uniref:2-C-methyl-D-erythritol 2,4-cyclodiphosphate synthase n=1 Tax=Dictyoglomus thermophilum TaxID=14 RepID=A0A7V3ZI63_DICTH|nr:2-C-methyl-D-erythritol 2,4-cyclodiphosphate synthase [Dictyoglomus thermophilum]MCX7719899.1 2-C-methyl-D-erythritol 2,4-cyclodiphosphate synthase [Dictyoglomus thermophilum]TYT22652.1 2-C-methyl-D-erythritol 2,4-cyclodiphosphate synthase [Dictyoglomus thermophilum]
MDGGNSFKIRVGLGYDVHPFQEGRDLFLGGIKIPFHKGLKGHSDGDVLIHAIADALLGASALPDIGYFFPNDDKSMEGISSVVILKRVKDLLEEKGVNIINIDSIIIAEEPKILPFRDKIIKNLSSILEIPESSLNVKATTNEKLGFIGRGEGIAVFAVALVSF